MHTIILLEARVDVLETQLLEVQVRTPAGTGPEKPTKPQKNGGPVSQNSVETATEASTSPGTSPS